MCARAPRGRADPALAGPGCGAAASSYAPGGRRTRSRWPGSKAFRAPVTSYGVHWDLILDLRKGGRLTADGEEIQVDEEFI